MFVLVLQMYLLRLRYNVGEWPPLVTELLPLLTVVSSLKHVLYICFYFYFPISDLRARFSVLIVPAPGHLFSRHKLDLLVSVQVGNNSLILFIV